MKCMYLFYALMAILTGNLIKNPLQKPCDTEVYKNYNCEENCKVESSSDNSLFIECFDECIENYKKEALEKCKDKS